jgi:hypothetical protein
LRAVEFCYWLQGAFELAQLPLTAEQIACVQKHLALVEATPQTGQPKQATDFCSWLRGGLDFISPGDARQVATIRTKLNDCFEHAIDGMYPNQEKLNAIHNGNSVAATGPKMGETVNGVTMRC